MKGRGREPTTTFLWLQPESKSGNILAKSPGQETTKRGEVGGKSSGGGEPVCRKKFGGRAVFWSCTIGMSQAPKIPQKWEGRSYRERYRRVWEITRPNVEESAWRANSDEKKKGEGG